MLPADTGAIPASRLALVPTSGLSTMCHSLPSQCRTSVWTLPPLGDWLVGCVIPGLSTLPGPEPGAAGGGGVGGGGGPEVLWPTAQASFADSAETLRSWLSPCPE